MEATDRELTADDDGFWYQWALDQIREDRASDEEMVWWPVR